MGLLTMIRRLFWDEARISALETQMIVTQAQIDAETAKVVALTTTLNTAVPLIQSGFANLEAEMATFKQANPGLDISGLDTALATLKTGVDVLPTLVPADALPVASTSGTPTLPTPPVPTATAPVTTEVPPTAPETIPTTTETTPTSSAPEA